MSRVRNEPDIYILHAGDASGEALAGILAADLSGLPATPVLVTADQLVTRYRDYGRLPAGRESARILPAP